jgi:hypothetical protein
MKVEKTEQKRQWLSDDFIWEATLGYREDPSVEAVGSPSDSVGVENERNQKAEKIAAEKKSAKESSAKSSSAPAGQRPLFETQEINRSIRPQQDVTPRKSKRGPSVTWMVGAALFLAVVSGVGWYYLSGDGAPQKLKDAVNKGTNKFTEITDKVTTSIGEMGKSKTDAATSDAKGEEAMARMRERLESMKAEAAQKEASKPSPAAPAPAAPVEVTPTEVTPAVDAPVTEPTGEAAPAPTEETQAEVVTEEAAPEAAAVNAPALETVDDVMKALSASEGTAKTTGPEATEPDAPSESAPTTGDEVGTVNSVDALPVVDEAAGDGAKADATAAGAAAPSAETGDAAEDEEPGGLGTGAATAAPATPVSPVQDPAAP